MNEQALLQDVRRYWAMIHKRRGIVLTCLGVSLMAAFVYNYTSRPVYQAVAEILIAHDAPNVLATKEVVEMGQGASDYYQTQYQLLRGRLLAEKVVERLKGDPVIAAKWSEEVAAGPIISPLERIQRWFGKAQPPPVDATGLPLAPGAGVYRSRLIVEPVSGTLLVKLRFNAYNPLVAAAAVNKHAEVYIQQALEFRFATSSDATGWLADRIKEQQKKVEDAERGLQAYREREGLVNIEERQGLVEQKMTALTTAVMNARTERISKESLYTQMRALSSSQLETLSLVMQSPVVQGLKSQLAELQKELTRLFENLGERHPDMVRVRSQIRTAEDKIRAEIQNIVRSVESDYLTARQQEANLQANLEAMKVEAQGIARKTSLEYNVLRREVESSQGVYQDLLNRSKETGLASELKATNIRVSEPAEPPGRPISPRKGRNYQLAFLIGLAIGIGLALLFEHMDNTLKTPEDVKELGLPFLGMVPDVTAKPGAASLPRPSPLILKNPNSAVAEAYRVLRTNLIFSSAESHGRVLLVSSANPGEGKTTTVANLAASLAVNGAKVLAVDADLRRPTMHQHFGIAKTPGLTDLIVGKSQASQSIQATRYKGLQVLPCGYVPPNPAELLGSRAMKEVVAALRIHYEWVIIDTPPILAMADTPVLCPIVDGVILVVGAEVSGRPAIQRALDQITSVGGKVTGVVLNKVDLARNSYYYGQYYGEYYRSYYAEGASRQSTGVAAGGPRPVRRS